MQKILIVIHAPPYGSERCLSALRMATALVGREADRPELRLFMMSDAVTAALPHQMDGNGNGNGLQGLLELLVSEGVAIKLCRTCAMARGLMDLPLIPGISIGTLPELAEWTMAADKVITF